MNESNLFPKVNCISFILQKETEFPENKVKVK